MESRNEIGSRNEIRPEDIAIVGMACRFPGAASIDEFWRNLCDGEESTTFFTDDELLAAGVQAALLADPRYVRAGQILDGVDLFDADYFRITHEEAELLDPQQRLFLECAQEALENAGYDPDAQPDPIGVYAGVGLNTYLLQNLADRFRYGSTMDRYRLMLAGDKDFLATRVAYKLNLRGPTVNVNTACSTSLVALHMACLSLLGGECALALVGSSHIKVPQVEGYLYQQGMIFSPDGHCRAFDEAAQGTVVGDGVGVVVLKRLAEAVAGGDWIYAVIKGTAINNDGAAKTGYTAPSVAGQVAVISDAQALADCPPETITYVEAHGTGTPLGDAVELAALRTVFDGGAPDSCAIGSVKTNVGHLDTAAGMAGLIKTALMLRHRKLVPSLNFHEPNPELMLAKSPFRVSTELADWNADGPLRAGVSSFGIGGANAHAVLQEPPVRQPTASDGAAQLLVLSARTPAALEKATENLARYLRKLPSEVDFAAVAYTLAVGRRAHEYRRAVVADNARDAAMALMVGDPERVLTGRAAATDDVASGDELSELGRQWTRGAAVDWTVTYANRPKARVPLPTYPFERKRYWVQPPTRHEASTVDGASEPFRARFDAADNQGKGDLVLDFLRREAADMLGHPVEGDQELFQLGFDSLDLIEIVAKLGAELDRDMPVALFGVHPTINAYVRNLLESLPQER